MVCAICWATSASWGKFTCRMREPPAERLFETGAVEVHEEAPKGGAEQDIGRIGYADVAGVQDTGRIHKYPCQDSGKGRDEYPENAKERLFVSGYKIPLKQLPDEIPGVHDILDHEHPTLKKPIFTLWLGS